MILTILFLIILGGCCNSSEQGIANQGAPEYSRREIRTCGYENSRITALCIPQADYIIKSHRPLPAKLKVSFSFNGRTEEHYNECASIGDFKVLRNPDSGLITFGAQRKRFYDGVVLEIIDLGENCDNDAVFYSAFTIPNIELIPNDRDEAAFDLEN